MCKDQELVHKNEFDNKEVATHKTKFELKAHAEEVKEAELISLRSSCRSKAGASGVQKRKPSRSQLFSLI